MNSERFRLLAADGPELHGCWHFPETPISSSTALAPHQKEPSARLIIVTHGLGEHSGRYGHVTQAFLKEGYTVVTHDLRGHGRSGGRRGDAPSFEAILNDFQLLVETVYRRGSEVHGNDLKFFLFGHSFGGLTTLAFIRERLESLRIGLAGAVVGSPWLRLAFNPPWWKLALGRLVWLVNPGFRQITGVDQTRLSRDEAFLKQMPDLDLCHHLLSARLFYAARDAAQRTLSGAASITAPLMLVHGILDPVTSWQATNEFYQALSSPCKTLKLYANSAHESHNDFEREKVIAEIVEWVNAR